MKTEYEAKFLGVNINQLRNKIESLGFVCVYERKLMKRVLFDHPNINKAFIRIRDEGEYTTMTGKQIIDEQTVDGMREIEFIVSDFNSAKAFMNFLGIQTRSYQETYREKWKLDDVELTIDERPGLDPFVEVEGVNEEIVNGVCRDLELDIKNACFGAVDVIYEISLGIPKEELNQMKMITFDNPPTKQ